MSLIVDIPLEIKNDLVYCQRALANHILMHQRVSTAVRSSGKESFKSLKKLNHIEKEMLAIGNEQKNIFNRLRLIIDLLILNETNVEVPSKTRKQLTDTITEEISRYSDMCGPNIKPMLVQERLTGDELDTYFVDGTKPIVPTVTIEDHIDDYIRRMEDDQIEEYKNGRVQSSASPSSDDVMEVLLTSDDGSNDGEDGLRPKKRMKQESLLKPKAERFTLPKEEESEAPPAAINLSRLKLKEALNKAKGGKNMKPTSPILPAPIALSVVKAKRKTPSPDLRAAQSKTSKPTSRSNSRSTSRSKSGSPISSDNTPEYPELPPEEPEPMELSKELHLRLFGLYTHKYSRLLMARRMERKRRNCTSTARDDFHYGKLDLFEKQYAKRNNKRQFLYSPPATRAVARKRRNTTGAHVAAAAAAAQSFRDKVFKAGSTSSNSASTSDDKDKVCLTCFKKNNLSKCVTCQAAFHIACHSNAVTDLPMKVRERQCQVCCLQLKKNNKSIR